MMAGRGVLSAVLVKRLPTYGPAGVLLVVLSLLLSPAVSLAAAATNKIAWMSSPNQNQWVIKIMNLDGEAVEKDSLNLS